jgi:hypothetical protein
MPLVARLDEESVPDMTPAVVEPMHGVTVLLGAGMPINELTPPLSNSVEPRGIVPPLSAVAALVAEDDSGDARPVEATADDVDGQLLESMPEPMPPPSNVEPVPVDPDVPAPVVLLEDVEEVDMEEEDIEVVPTQFVLFDIGPIGVGPTPPGSISVAPSGIPVGRLDAVEPGIPSGDVNPMLGVVVMLWAAPASHPNTRTTAAMINRRM